MTQTSKTPARTAPARRTAARKAADAAAIANFKTTVASLTGDGATKEIALAALTNLHTHLVGHPGGGHTTGLIRLALEEAQWAFRTGNYRSTVIRANRGLSY